MTKLQTLAKHGTWEIARDYNGTVFLHTDECIFECGSPYDALRQVTDVDARKDMAAQMEGK